MDRTLHAIIKDRDRLERDNETLRLQLRASNDKVRELARMLEIERNRQTWHYKVTPIMNDDTEPRDQVSTVHRRAQGAGQGDSR